ncbi:MAG: sugar phosphate isomerase/epimerase [Candidatus Latescibacterota bacterium]|nr:sugar phosphate isomerase/epimerase [Candidatus Latescibacterota bacterium]
MQLVFSPTLCPDLLLPDVLALAKAAGFSRLELFRAHTESTPVHDDWSVPMVRDAIKDAGLALAGFNIRNLTGRKADSDDHNLGYNLRQLEWDIHLGRALGLNTMSTKGGARTDEARADLIEGVNKLLENIPDITLNLGNQPGNRLENLADYQAVMPELPDRARALLDTGHLLTTNEPILPFAEAQADRIGLVHLRDQQGAKPVPFGQGDLPFADLFKILKDGGYDGLLVVELEEVDWDEPLPAAITAREYLEDLLN